LGAVATGDAGTDVIITNTGTPEAGEFNFTIPRGNTGATGPATELSVANTFTGAAGSEASVTISGTAPNQSLAFTIPQGIQGIQGPQGVGPVTIADTAPTSPTDGQLWMGLENEVLSIYSTTKARWINPIARSGIFDPNALFYIEQVEAADGQALEASIRSAIDAFVRGCKLDTFDIVGGDIVAGASFRNWDRIKASCILAGARTLTGALVPLVGTAPSNNNFVNADYVRTTGLKGNGSSKFLNLNRNNNADPQNNNHFSINVTQGVNASSFLIAAGTGSATGRSGISQFGNTMFFRNNSTVTTAGQIIGSGFYGISRSKESGFVFRDRGSAGSSEAASQVPFDGNLGVFAEVSGSGYDASRINFYSRGEALDIAALEARITTLNTSIGAALS
jgi:hypothetical protein